MPAGVDEAATSKPLLTDIAKETRSVISCHAEATRLLGIMLGGYNIPHWSSYRMIAKSDVCQRQKYLGWMFDAFHDVEEKRQTGNTLAQEVMESANAEWFW